MALEIKGGTNNLEPSLVLKRSLTSKPVIASNDLDSSAYILSKSETNGFSLAGAALAFKPAASVVVREVPKLVALPGGLGVGGAQIFWGIVTTAAPWIAVGAGGLALGGGVGYGLDKLFTKIAGATLGEKVYDLFHKEPTINPLEKEKQFRQLDVEKMREAYGIDMSLALHQLGLHENGRMPVYFDVRAQGDDPKGKGKKGGVGSNDDKSDLTEEEFRQQMLKMDFVEVRDTKTGKVSFTMKSDGLDPQEQMLLEARANPLRGPSTGVMEKFSQALEEAKRRGNLKINDLVRPGYMNPNIPVREIEITIGQGTTRYSIQVVISLIQGGKNFSAKADLFRLTFDGKGPAANLTDAPSIGYARDWNFFGTPYYEIEPGLTEEGMRAYPPELAVKAVAPCMGGFEDLVAEFLELVDPH